jgi:hypothetical protein
MESAWKSCKTVQTPSRRSPLSDLSATGTGAGRDPELATMVGFDELNPL